MSFETRYEALKRDDKRPNLRVYVCPFSHNDPGWLRTFLSYFQQDSRQILNFVIDRMQEYTDMTFIWAEITLLQLWWDQAHPTKQRALKHLIKSGRFEIVTGGWVGIKINFNYAIRYISVTMTMMMTRLICVYLN